MEITINKLYESNTNINKDNSFRYIRNRIKDTIENKKKYGIPLLSIIEDYVYEKEEVSSNKPEFLENKLVSLTFDDGLKNTNELLEILNRNHSRATFFILGNKIRGNEDAIKNIKSYGNEIGIQGYSDKPFTNMSLEDVDAEITGTYNMLSGLGVNPSNIVRPPHGKLNQTIKEQVKSPFVLWNIDADDIRDDKDTIKSNIVNNIIPGSIIKLHDASEKTLEALDEILPELIKDGYRFVTIDEMNKRYANNLIPGKVYAKIKDYQ